MKKHLALVFSTGLFVVQLGAAQEPIYPPGVTAPKPNPTKGSKETVDQKKTTTDSGTKKTSDDTLIGKVDAYESGKWIRVTTPGKSEGTRTFDLQGKDLTAHVNSGVKPGTWVSVTEKTDSNGHKTITVNPSKQASRSQ
jgi:hypothetical protein